MECLHPVSPYHRSRLAGEYPTRLTRDAGKPINVCKQESLFSALLTASSIAMGAHSASSSAKCPDRQTQDGPRCVQTPCANVQPPFLDHDDKMSDDAGSMGESSRSRSDCPSHTTGSQSSGCAGAPATELLKLASVATCVRLFQLHFRFFCVNFDVSRVRKQNVR